LLVHHAKQGYSLVEEENPSEETRNLMVNIVMGSPRTTSFLSGDKMKFEKLSTGIWKWENQSPDIKHLFTI